MNEEEDNEGEDEDENADVPTLPSSRLAPLVLWPVQLEAGPKPRLVSAPDARPRVNDMLLEGLRREHDLAMDVADEFDLAELLAEAIHIAEAAPRLASSVVHRHAAADEVAHRHLEVELELGVDVGVDPADAGGEAEDATESGNARHGDLSGSRTASRASPEMLMGTCSIGARSARRS